jgi:hypothetical protein
MRSEAEFLVEIAFSGEVIHWRGPSPFFFVPIPESQVGEVRYAAQLASYGWGCVPVEARLAGVDFTTSLFPRDGGYLLPLKDAVRKKAKVALADTVQVEMRIRDRK